jgi:hypothetical protein
MVIFINSCHPSHLLTHLCSIVRPLPLNIFLKKSSIYILKGRANRQTAIKHLAKRSISSLINLKAFFFRNTYVIRSLRITFNFCVQQCSPFIQMERPKVMHMAILLICCELWLSLTTVHGSHNVDTWISKQKKRKFDDGDTSRLILLNSSNRLQVSAPKIHFIPLLH